MPTYSSVGHALQFGTNTPTVTIVGTDTDGYIIYDMSTSGTFYQFAPNTKYFALQIIFDTPFVIPPGIILDPANTATAEVLTAQPGVEFYVDQNDVTTSYFKISGISWSNPLLGPEVLMWAYQAGGEQVGVGGGGTVTSVATDSTLTGGPITTSGTLGINLAHANTWTAKQTFSAVGLTGATSGSIIFADGTASLAQDNSNLFWNATNKQLGIGTNSPDAYMTIVSPSIEQGNFVFDLNMTNGDRVIIDDGAQMVVTGSANWGSGVFSKQAFVAQTISPALSAESTDAASVGNQINSAALMFRSNGWRTPSNGSYSMDTIMYMRPTNVSLPRATLVLTEREIGVPTYNEFMNFDYSGSITLLGNASSASIQFSAGSSAGVSVGNTGKIRYNESTHIFEQSLNGAAYTALGGGGGSTGPKIIPTGFPANSILGTPTVVGAVQFNPADYTGFTTIKYRTVFSNGNNSVSTSVVLHDVTHSVDIYTTTYSGSTAYQVAEQTLTVSTAGTNTIANSATIYEVRIFVNSPLTGGTNYIQLYSAEFRVT